MSTGTLYIIIRFGALFSALLSLGYLLERRFSAITRFRYEKSTALNLAVIRIAAMGAMLAIVHLPYIQWFAHLQEPLFFPIRVWQPWLLFRPNTSQIITVSYVALVVANICGIVGLWGRFSCFVSAILFAFLMGIPQLFGQVNHTEHHLVLFALILASSPCSDTLSVDALIAAIRNGDKRRFVQPRWTLTYAFPIKAMLLMLSLFYLFPGIWKIARVGGVWFSGKNMQLLLAMKMYEAGQTPFRLWALSHLPIHAISSLGTIIFELGFLFAILFPRLRPLAGLAGICFHGTIFFLMGINFGALVACYVILINWTHLFDMLAQLSRQSSINILFDANCQICRRTVSLLYNLDWLNRLTLHPNNSESDWPAEPRKQLRAETAMDRFVAIDSNGKIAFGYDAYEMIAGRVPLLWPMRLLMFIPGVSIVGGRIYNWVAQSRTCSLQDARSSISINAPEKNVGFGLMGIVASLLFVSMILMGVTRSINAWPISCFPTFDWQAGETQLLLSIDAIDHTGQHHTWTVNFDPSLGEVMTPERLQGMVRTFTNGNQPFSKARANALLKLWTRYHSVDAPITRAVFYADEYHVMPNLMEKAPISHRQLGEIISNSEYNLAFEPSNAEPVQAAAP
ncbi:MAG TPA: DCC1-like thiol-disulfide oxidoreductase family protein [Opitutaceae bacterium]